MNYNLELAEKVVDNSTTVFWFRRDLRVDDNAGLYHALSNHKNVLALFIFDTVILGQLEDVYDRRVDFIHGSLSGLKAQLESIGSTLLTVIGDPVAVFKKINPAAVYANHDYEPYARKRDEAVGRVLARKKTQFTTFKDQVIFEKEEVVKASGEPYAVFTPYSRNWKATLTSSHVRSYPSRKYLHNLLQREPLPFPSLEDIGFRSTNTVFPERIIKVSSIVHYQKRRDYPAEQGTSRLSVHLRFGTVSIRKLVQVALKHNEAWLNELIWREFYQMILWHFPHVEKHSFKPAYDQIAWLNNVDDFEAWKEGKTGYPIVDAGMRELNSTGFMHNRVRMITASFLTKHLLIDWRWGEAYFAQKLLDYELASNNGGWQWAAGSGCDAAPYFRVFNPTLQMKKFDPNMEYVKKWICEWGTGAYPSPIITHEMARDRAIKTYRSALQAQHGVRSNSKSVHVR